MDLTMARWIVETYDNSIHREYYKDNISFMEWLNEAKRIVYEADYATNF
mgnify:CR=1 FL=1